MSRVITALRISPLALNIFWYVVNSPGPFELPVPWHPLNAHLAWKIGAASAANVLGTEQSSELFIGFAAAGELLLHATTIVQSRITRLM
jgi:hypothetical protein